MDNMSRNKWKKCLKGFYQSMRENRESTVGECTTDRWCRYVMWSCVERCSGGNSGKHINQKNKTKNKTFKWVRKENVMKEVCSGRKGGWWVYLRQSWSQWSQRWGRIEQGEAVTATHSNRLGLMSSLRHRAGRNYACLNICHTHTRAHKRKCNLCALHTYTQLFNGI